jgi:hypothetical protein
VETDTLLGHKLMRLSRHLSTYIDITRVTCVDSQSGSSVRRPKPSSTISTGCSEIDAHRTPVNIPDWVLMSSVRDHVCHGIHGPQSCCRIGRARQKIFWGCGRAANRIESQRIDGPTMSDKFAGRCSAFLPESVERSG